MKTLILGVAFATATACGGGAPVEPTPDASTGGLSTCFGGRWSVSAVVASGSKEAVEVPWREMTIDVDPSGSTLRITGACPDGTGAVSASGADNYAAGDVNVSCAIAMPGETISVVFRRFGMAYVHPGLLVLQMRGDTASPASPVAITATLQAIRVGSASGGGCR